MVSGTHVSASPRTSGELDGGVVRLQHPPRRGVLQPAFRRKGLGAVSVQPFHRPTGPRAAPRLGPGVRTRARSTGHGRDNAQLWPVLRAPFAGNERPLLEDAAMQQNFCFSVRIGYFRVDDWLFFVVRDLRQLLHFDRDNLAAGRATKESIAEDLRTIDQDPLRRNEAKEAPRQARATAEV